VIRLPRTQKSGQIPMADDLTAASSLHPPLTPGLDHRSVVEDHRDVAVPHRQVAGQKHILNRMAHGWHTSTTLIEEIAVELEKHECPRQDSNLRHRL
jgi:hypothetical protein